MVEALAAGIHADGLDLLLCHILVSALKIIKRQSGRDVKVMSIDDRELFIRPLVPAIATAPSHPAKCPPTPHKPGPASDARDRHGGRKEGLIQRSLRKNCILFRE